MSLMVRSTRTAVGLVFALALSTGLAACTSHGGAAVSEALVPQPPGDLQDTAWHLVAIGDTDAVPAPRQVTFVIDDGAASGKAPCNNYRMPFTNDGEDVTTGPLVATQVACAPRFARFERRFFRELEAVDTAEKQAQRLVLSGPDDVRLTFERDDDD